MPLVVLMFALLSMPACSKDREDGAQGKTQDRTQSKAARTAEPPKMGGRTFSSDLPLRVFIIREAGGAVEWIGETPSAPPLDIPFCASWGVQARKRVDMQALAREIAAKEIPHLGLGPWAVDGDLVRLEGLTGLRELDLAETQITDAGLADLKKALPRTDIQR